MPNILSKSSNTKNSVFPQVVKVDPANPPRFVIKQCVALLKKGEIVAFPTETVYGVAAAFGLPRAQRKLYNAKGRAKNKPSALLVHSRKQALELCGPVPLFIKKMMECFWPGPLTLVLPDRKDPGKTVGLRYPANILALCISRMFKKPLILTSANKSGRQEARTAGEVVSQLGRYVPLVLDGGRVRYGRVSTVYQWTPSFEGILRAGVVTQRQIKKIKSGAGTK